ncbi:MAG: oligosaccharide flippase family protein, partial [Acidobacteria bacterium]|nr:oligosaccharide flippase family protein [Acidobacteriota bacterium]
AARGGETIAWIPPGGADSGRDLGGVLGGNVRSLAGSQVTERLAGLFALVTLARVFGRADFGRYAVAVALVSLLAVLTEFGTGPYLVREGARRPERLGDVLGQALALRVSLGVLSTAAAIPIGLALGYDRPTLTAVLLFSAASVLKMAAGAFLLGLQALERLPDLAAVRAQQAALQALAIGGAALAGAGLVGASWAALGAAALCPPWAWRRLRRRWRGPLRLLGEGLRAGLRSAGPFAASSALLTLLTYLDSIMVQAFRGNTAAGLYSSAYRIVIAFDLLPIVVNDSLARAIAHLAGADRARMARLHSRAVALLVMLAVPIAVGGALLAPRILRLAFGAQYAAAAPALALLLASLVFAFPGWVRVTTANALGRERAIARALVAVVASNAAANLLLIPRWGITGAAAATLGAEALFFGLMSVILRRSGARADAATTVLKPAVAAAAMAAVVVPLRALPLPVPVAAGAAVYAGMLLVLRAITAEDREALLRLIRRTPASRRAGRTGARSASRAATA